MSTVSDARARMERVDNWANEHRKEILAAFAIVAAIVLAIGLSLTWFVYNKSLSTVSQVKVPSTIQLVGPGDSAMESFDLSYDGDDLGPDKKVTIKRAFSVKSKDSFYLYVANTTNISGLKVHLYEATENASGETPGDVMGEVNGKKYSWRKTTEDDLLANGSFTTINADQFNSAIAKTIETGDSTFGDHTNVQQNAAPLYRYKRYDIGSSSEYQYKHFIIEFTWTESEKETDVAYVIARDATGN